MRFSLWAWLFWAVPIYLAMEVGAFLIVGLAFKKSIGELITPFLAFAVPALIFFPLVWWLRILEKQGTSPKRLARGWVSSTALFLIAAMAATFYSAFTFASWTQTGPWSSSQLRVCFAFQACTSACIAGRLKSSPREQQQGKRITKITNDASRASDRQLGT
jgi:hypothetical protein